MGGGNVCIKMEKFEITATCTEVRTDLTSVSISFGVSPQTVEGRVQTTRAITIIDTQEKEIGKKFEPGKVYTFTITE